MVKFEFYQDGSNWNKKLNFDAGNCACCGEYKRLDKHHRIKRSHGGDDDDIIYLCRECHYWVETHPIEAANLRLHDPVYKMRNLNDESRN